MADGILFETRGPHGPQRDGPALGTVKATMSYLSPITEKPQTYNYEPPAGTPRENFSRAEHIVSIEDMRGREDDFSLDRHGFAVVRHHTAAQDFDDEAVVREVYYPESEALLAEQLGAERVLIFDHTIRRHRPGEPDHRDGLRQPVSRVHVDQTPRATVERVRRHAPDDAERLLAGRVRIINLWRPLRGPVLDHPLAMIDGSSLSPKDLVATDLLYRDRTGETYSVLFNPAHRWHYLSSMQPDEALLLKCADNVEDGRTRLSPHSAFTDPRTPVDAPPRESIELRALVFG